MSKKKKNRQLILQHRKWYREFPSFTYPQKDREIGHVSKDFIRIVKEAIRDIDFYDEGFFSDEDRDACRRVKQIGIESFITEINKSLPRDKAYRKFLRLFDMVGDYIYEYISRKKMFDLYFPYNDVSFVPPRGSNFNVYFDALLSIQPSGCSRVYYSRNPPLIAVGGMKYKLAFTRHAIERMGDRNSFNKKCYEGTNYFYNYFLKGSNYEFVCTPGCQAVSFYEACSPGGFRESNLHVFNIPEPKGIYFYRAGYCPVEFAGGFAVAKTWLTPGMVGTPEWELMQKANLSFPEKGDLIRSKENLTSSSTFYESKDLHALKWFHENGVPQVKKAGEIIIPASTAERMAPVSSSPVNCSSSPYIPSAHCTGHVQAPSP